MIDDRVVRVLTTEAMRLEPGRDLAMTVIVRGRRLRRVRRIGAAAAVVGCVAAAVAVPGALLDSAGPDPVATPTAIATPTASVPPRVGATEGPALYPPVSLIEKWLSSLEQGSAPRAPFTDRRYLYDGPHKVRLPAASKLVESWAIGRAPGGWLVASQATAASRGSGQYAGQFGVLAESGHFRVLASGVLQGASISPDGTRAAIAVIPSGGKPRASVFDLRTGSVVSETTIGSTTRVNGWNPSGIWLSSSPDTAMPSLVWARWIPGRPVQEVGRGATPWSRSTDRMLARTDDCERVVTFGRTGFTTIAEYCGFGDGFGVLSPDGTVYVTPDQVARTIGTDRQVRLEVPPGLEWGDTAWEDPRHVLITFNLDKPKSAKNYTVVRCNVGSGNCERAYATDIYPAVAAP